MGIVNEVKTYGEYLREQNLLTFHYGVFLIQIWCCRGL